MVWLRIGIGSVVSFLLMWLFETKGITSLVLIGIVSFLVAASYRYDDEKTLFIQWFTAYALIGLGAMLLYITIL